MQVHYLPSHVPGDGANIAHDMLCCQRTYGPTPMLSAHLDVGLKALDAGLHLLMEKPMTTDVVEARRLLDASRARPDQAFVVNTTANFRDGAIHARDLIAAGRLGEVRHINCIFAAPLEWLFDGPQNRHWVEASGSMAGNGFGWGQFAHTFSWIFMVTGLTPLRVYAVSSKAPTTGADLFDAVRPGPSNAPGGLAMGAWSFALGRALVPIATDKMRQAEDVGRSA